MTKICAIDFIMVRVGRFRSYNYIKSITRIVSPSIVHLIANIKLKYLTIICISGLSIFISVHEVWNVKNEASTCIVHISAIPCNWKL